MNDHYKPQFTHSDALRKNFVQFESLQCFCKSNESKINFFRSFLLFYLYGPFLNTLLKIALLHDKFY